MSEKTKKEQHKSAIGGQALIEGVMMKGIYHSAMACRLPNGEIDVEVWDEKNGAKAWYKKIPFLRGIINMATSLIDGYKCLMKSAEKQITDEDDEEEEKGKVEIWLDEHVGEKLTGIIMVIAMIFSLAISLFLFMYIPTKIVSFMGFLDEIPFVKTLLEGVIKIAIFIGYLWVTSFMTDIKRTYMYHGAEHKTIACYESGKELTVENVKKCTRFHPRCGTSFIFIVLIISILVFSLVSWEGTALARVGIKLLCLPIIVGISYEIIRFAGRHDSVLSHILSWPGLRLQRLTTKEPDDSMMEVAIAAISPCIPENKEDDRW